MSLTRLQNSLAWDVRYSVPTCPSLNNPWLYMAYAQASLVISHPEISKEDILNHFFKCTPNGIENMTRWPDGSGGAISMDELLGAAYLHEWIARDILAYLDKHWGQFPHPPDKPSWLRHNMYRFVFMRPYLKAASGAKLCPFLDQLPIMLYILYGCFNRDATEAGGKLRRYLIIQKTLRFSAIRFAANIWRKVMLRRGMTMKVALSLEPREYPILSQIAPK